jgi:membrane protease YdiL (CAAX protease family)
MSTRRGELLLAAAGTLLALALWYLVFMWPRGVFWVKIAVAASILAGLSLAAMGPRRSEILTPRWADFVLGLLSAIVLYGVFYLGRGVLLALWPESSSYLALVYAPRRGISLLVVALLLLLVTGPAEEIFWRGLVQRVLVDRLGPARGLAAAVFLYTAVHVWTLNLPLLLAALAAGVFFGLLYLRSGRLPAVMVSHALWGVIIFVLFPLA